MRYRSLLAIVVAATSLAFACQMVQAAQPPQPGDAGEEEDARPDGGVIGAVAVQGNYAYVGIGPRLVVVDVSDPRRPTPVGHAGFWPKDAARFTGVATGIAVSGNHAFVTHQLHVRSEGDVDMVVFDVSNPSAPAVVGTYYVSELFAMGALGVAVSGQYAYVYVSGGLDVVDISRPSNPKHVAFWSTAGVPWSGISISVWGKKGEDLGQVGAAGSHIALVGNHAFLADRGGGLRVIDVSESAAPKEVGSCATPGYATGIAVVGKRAFVAVMGRGLRIIDVSDPSHPRDLGAYDHRGAIGSGVWGVTGVAAAGNYAYLHGIKGRESFGDAHRPLPRGGGLRVLNVSDPASPKLLHPSEGQSPAVDGPVIALALQDNYAYAGVGWRLVVADLSDAKNPAVVGSTRVLPCPLVDVAVAGNHAFVASGRGGLRVLDVSDAKAPKEIGSFRAAEAITKVTLAGNLALASTPGSLLVLDISDPKAPQQVSAYDTRGPTRPDGVPGLNHVAHVATFGKYACVTAGALPPPSDYPWPGWSSVKEGGGEAASGYSHITGSTVRVLDFSQPGAPKEVGIYAPSPGLGGGPTSDFFAGRGQEIIHRDAPKIAVAGDHLLVLDEGLRVVDLSYLAWRPWMPYLIALAAATSIGVALLVLVFRRTVRRWILVAALVFTVLPPALLLLVPWNLREVGHYKEGLADKALAATDRHAYSSAFGKVVGNYMYAGPGSTGLVVVDVSDPSTPKWVGSYETPGRNPRAVAVEGRYAFVACDRRGLQVLDISDPTAPKPVGFYDSPP